MDEPVPAVAVAPGGDAAVEPFDPRRFRRRLALDRATRGALLGGTLAAAVWIIFIHGDTGQSLRLGALTLDPYVALVMAMVPWIVLNVIAARAMHDARRAALHLGRGGAVEAEASLAAAMRRRPVSRRTHALRLHQLAELRHHQGRYAEVVMICRQLLAMDRPRPHDHAMRAQWLLMLVEAGLECGSLADAYQGLAMLHAMPLRLDQRLAQMMMQTHYEVLIGADANALYAWRRKAELSELLPQPLCGMLHAFLAVAAYRAQEPAAAAWLVARARLIAPRQLRHVFGRVGLPLAVTRTSAGAMANR